MGPPLPAVVDEVVVGLLGPWLDDHGFRKRGRTWRRRGDDAVAAVTYRCRWRNGRTAGDLAIWLGASYASLGHDVDDRAEADVLDLAFLLQGLRLEERETLHSWGRLEADDPGGLSDLAAAVEEDWAGYGIPFLAAASSSPAALGAHLATLANTAVVRRAVDDLARPLGDPLLLRALAHQALAAATADDGREAAKAQPRLDHGLKRWEWTFRLAAETGVDITAADLASAATVLQAAATGKLATEWHTGSEEAAARYLADRLGIDPPPMAAPTPFNRTL